MSIGARLKELRNRLDITIREVEDYSHRIAEAEGNEEFFISNPWITQIEYKEVIPSIYKLYSLSIIYRIKFSDLLQLYLIHVERVRRCQSLIPLANTHLTN